jgi:hypothetical protein
MLRRKQRAQLHNLLIERFSKDELCTLCFKLDISYEEFPDNPIGLARELILYCERRNRLGDLIETAIEMRPDIGGEVIPPPQPPGVWPCSQVDRKAQFVGSITSRKYHSAECGWVRRIAPKNRLCFASQEAARDFGYSPCAICAPPS